MLAPELGTGILMVKEADAPLYQPPLDQLADAGPGGRDEVAGIVELGGVERGAQPHEVSAGGPTTSANRSR
jgi:hypothetical protein